MTQQSAEPRNLLDEDRLLSQWEVIQLTGYSPASLRRRVAPGEFPAPLRLHLTVTACGRDFSERRWWYSEVTAWVHAQIPLAAKPQPEQTTEGA